MGGIFPESTLRMPSRQPGPFARHKHETLESGRLRVAFWKTFIGYSWRLLLVDQNRFFLEQSEEFAEKGYFRSRERRYW